MASQSYRWLCAIFAVGLLVAGAGCMDFQKTSTTPGKLPHSDNVTGTDVLERHVIELKDTDSVTKTAHADFIYGVNASNPTTYTYDKTMKFKYGTERGQVKWTRIWASTSQTDTPDTTVYKPQGAVAHERVVSENQTSYRVAREQPSFSHAGGQAAPFLNGLRDADLSYAGTTDSGNLIFTASAEENATLPSTFPLVPRQVGESVDRVTVRLVVTEEGAIQRGGLTAVGKHNGNVFKYEYGVEFTNYGSTNVPRPSWFDAAQEATGNSQNATTSTPTT